MRTTKVWSRAITQDSEWRTLFTSSALIALGLALLLVGAGLALLLGGGFGYTGIKIGGGIFGFLLVTILIILRQDELAATLVIAVHLYVDWFGGLNIVAQLMALVLLVIFYLARSSRSPWVEPRALWLWALFLGLCIFPAIRGATDYFNIVLYYPNVILGALIMFWLGTVVSRDSSSLRLLWMMLSVFATLIALHTIIQEVTGKFLFSTGSHDLSLAQVANYQLGPTAVSRVGSFFLDPDYNGAFLSMMLFLPLSLIIVSSSFLEKAFYLAETLLILLAMLFTYSGAAWIGAIVGFLTFFMLIGRTLFRFLLPLCVLFAVVVLLVLFPSQFTLLFQHAAGPDELSLRIGIWQTAIRVIMAYPLTGIGLSHALYLQIADPYRVLAQSVPIDHPHDSYLEFGAMAGIPVLLVFVALLFCVLWWAYSNWRQADGRTRSLIGAGIAAAIALSICSVATNGWTLFPLAACGWLILGAVSSPLLARRESSHKITKAGMA
jgi:O-antigen ligase